jgi:hypothetical protein
MSQNRHEQTMSSTTSPPHWSHRSGAEQVGVDLGAQGVGELVEVQTGGGGDLECLRGPGEQPGGVAEDGVEVVVAGVAGEDVQQVQDGVRLLDGHHGSSASWWGRTWSAGWLAGVLSRPVMVMSGPGAAVVSAVELGDLELGGLLVVAPDHGQGERVEGGAQQLVDVGFPRMPLHIAGIAGRRAHHPKRMMARHRHRPYDGRRSPPGRSCVWESCADEGMTRPFGGSA